jgi:hypothetical protein
VAYENTVELDDDLPRRAQQSAAGIPLRAYIEDALPIRARATDRQGRAGARSDVADRAALYDLMERE